MKIQPPKFETILILAAVAGGLYLLYRGIDKAEAIANALNPLNPDNIVYGGLSSLGAALTGNPQFNSVTSLAANTDRNPLEYLLPGFGTLYALSDTIELFKVPAVTPEVKKLTQQEAARALAGSKPNAIFTL